MSIYGHLLESNNVISLSYDAQLQEFNNFDAFMSNIGFLNEDTITIVQEKFSLSKVKEYMVKAFEIIKKAIRNLIQKFKDFINNKKAKILVSKCAELEKQLKESEADKIRIQADLDKAESEKEKIIANAHELKQAGRDKDAKNATINAKVSIVASKIINNDYIYFDMYDYMKKGYDPQRLVNCSPFEDLIKMSQFKDFSIEDVFNDWLKDNGDNFNFLDANILGFDPDKLWFRGYNSASLHDAIEAHISKKERYKDVIELAKHCKWLLHGYQVSACQESLAKYQKAIGAIETKMGKYFGYDNNSWKNEDSEATDVEIIQVMRKYCSMLDLNVRLFAVLGNFAGRAVGAASSAVIALESCYGIDFDSEELRWY